MKSIGSKRQEILRVALSWLSTPYQHQACVKHEGVDCAMFVYGVAKECNLVMDEGNIPNYSPQWHFHDDKPLLTDILEQFGCVKKKNNTIYPGDIIVFTIGKVEAHLGIAFPDNKFIHAVGGTINRVTIQSLYPTWDKRVTSIYKMGK